MTKPRYKTKAVRVKWGKTIIMRNWINPLRTDFYYIKKNSIKDVDFEIECIYNDEQTGFAYDYIKGEKNAVARFINMIKVRNVIRRLKIST